jgi:sulfate adenylyltransferase large subunit
VDLLRFVTAGSVDDGKSTLIGRLLYDSKQVLEDTLADLRRTGRPGGSTGGASDGDLDDEFDLARLTDGLRAEREQGITIDVAYRYFATPRRKFIIADSPGHTQYTRNMVTGASTADLALILVDARAGVVEQTRRHAAIAGLLGIGHVVLCVNKMDLVEFDQARFDAICREFEFVSETVGLTKVTPIPVAALSGDNVVTRSPATPWYPGPPLLEFLETVPVPRPAADGPLRFPVQGVIRPQSASHPDYRGYTGTVAGGSVQPGDEVVVLPGGHRTRVAGVDLAGRPQPCATTGASVTLRLEDDLDVGRGSMIVAPERLPAVTRSLVADICWMDAEEPLRPRGQFLLKSSTQRVRAVVTELVDRLDIHTLARVGRPDEVWLNGLARVAIRTASPIVVDPYLRDRWTGSFILIDPRTHQTVAAGMVRSTDADEGGAAPPQAVVAAGEALDG